MQKLENYDPHVVSINYQKIASDIDIKEDEQRETVMIGRNEVKELKQKYQECLAKYNCTNGQVEVFREAAEINANIFLLEAEILKAENELERLEGEYFEKVERLGQEVLEEKLGMQLNDLSKQQLQVLRAAAVEIIPNDFKLVCARGLYQQYPHSVVNRIGGLLRKLIESKK